MPRSDRLESGAQRARRDLDYRNRRRLEPARRCSPSAVSAKGGHLALMSDDAWRWNFIAVGNKETPQNHLKLIRQAVRWLAQEPSFEQVQLRPIPTAQPGEKVMIKLKVLNDDFTPTRQASVQLRVFSPEGEPTLVSTGARQRRGRVQRRIHSDSAKAPIGSKPKPASAAKPWAEIKPVSPRRSPTAKPMTACRASIC